MLVPQSIVFVVVDLFRPLIVTRSSEAHFFKFEAEIDRKLNVGEGKEVAIMLESLLATLFANLQNVEFL